MKPFKKALLLLLWVAQIPVMSVSLKAQEIKQTGLKIFYSTGYDSKISEILTPDMPNKITDKGEYSQIISSGMIGVGYRYNWDVFGVGFDLTYSLAREDVYKSENSTIPIYSIDHNRLLFMPTGDFSYYRSSLFNIYGSASMGVMMYSQPESPNRAELAYQVNPIALRAGVIGFGAFIELGYGYKGIITTGLTLNF